MSDESELGRIAQMAKQYTQKELQDFHRKRLRALGRKGIDILFEEAASEYASIARVMEIGEQVSGYLPSRADPINWHHLYRGQCISADEPRPVQLTRMVEPPVELTSLGRCNVAKGPILYVTEDPRAVRYECRAQPGDRLYILQYDRKAFVGDSEFYCTIFGYDVNLLFAGDPNAPKGARRFFKRFYGKEIAKIDYFNSRLYEEFVRGERQCHPHPYGLIPYLCAHRFATQDSLDGIVYPSVAFGGGAKNVAVRPSSIRKVFVPSKVIEYLIDSDGIMRWQDGGTVSATGIIRWGEGLYIDDQVPIGISPRADYVALKEVKKHLRKNKLKSVRFSHPGLTGQQWLEFKVSLELDPDFEAARFEFWIDGIQHPAAGLSDLVKEKDGKYAFVTPKFMVEPHDLVYKFFDAQDREVVFQAKAELVNGELVISGPTKVAGE